MSKSFKTIFGILVIITTLCFKAGSQGTPDMTMPKAVIRGVVLLQDGETPASNLRVRVWDARTETIVLKTVTDDDGLFIVPEYDDINNFYVTIGPVKVDLAVLAARGATPQHNGVVVVLPKRVNITNTLHPVVVRPATVGTAAVGVQQVLEESPLPKKPITVSP